MVIREQNWSVVHLQFKLDATFTESAFIHCCLQNQQTSSMQKGNVKGLLWMNRLRKAEGPVNTMKKRESVEMAEAPWQSAQKR